MGFSWQFTSILAIIRVYSGAIGEIAMTNKFSINLLHNNKIASFTFNDHSKTTLYHFLLHIKKVAARWTKTTPFVGILDLSSADLYLSDYARRTLLRLPNHLPDDIFGAFALVAPAEAMSALNSYYDQSAAHRLNFKVGVFDNQTDAEKWAVSEFERLGRILNYKEVSIKRETQTQPQVSLA